MRSLTRGHMRAGIDNLRHSKLRSFWTCLGVVIGVTSVITVVSIGQGIKNQIGGQLHHAGKNLVTVRPAQLHTGGASKRFDSLSGVNISAPLTAHDVGVVAHTKGVQSSAPLSIVPGSVKGDAGTYADGFVVGTSSYFPSLVNQSLAYGNFWGSDDEGANVAVLGQHAAQKMFNVDVPLGYSFSFHGQTFVVRGIFNQFNVSPLSQQVNFDNAIFIPNEVAENLTNNTAPTYAILARAGSDIQTTQVSRNVEQALAKSHGGQGGFEVLSGNQNLAASDSILNLLTQLIAGIAAISLLVGGLGIMNVMLVSVSERMHEIGIRKAIGATNRQIMSQFLVESAALSMLGGIIGLAVAFLADLALRIWTDLTPAITWQLVLLATGVSLVVGIVFGTIPALQAARKDPITALRSE